MSTTFADLGVPEPIVAGLAARGITDAFPIQVATIADALAGKDLCGKAPTGSGKTIAFGVPMVARVTRSKPKRPHGLVLTPTRELAIQVAEELAALSSDLRVLAVYGGAGIEPQIKKLRAGIDIVVATPGRLLDLMDRNVAILTDVSFAVVDEADRMADMGFLPDVRRILDETRSNRQTVLFSATLDGAIDELVRRYQRNPVVHELEDEPEGDITHHFWLCERPGRVELLAKMVDRLGPTVVFCRTKHGSDRVARQLAKAGVRSAAIHGNRSQAQRERALEAFHRGDVAALVATDVAARGIHVEGVLGVVHYDLPGDPKDYIHRSGRTGRAGMSGTVVTLIDASQRKDAVKLKRGAGVDAEITDPDVAVLPEGPQQAFRPKRAASRVRDLDPSSHAGGGRPARSKRSGPKGSSPKQPRSKQSGPKPSGNERAGSSRGAATGSSETARSDQPRQSPSRQNRAARREKQFTDEERAQRTARNQEAEARKAKQRASSRSSSKHSSRSKPSTRGGSKPTTAGSRPSGDQVLPADTAGATKVRPSGASRRKAKRAALEAAGEPVPRTKKRRSGKKRPPPARNGGSR